MCWQLGVAVRIGFTAREGQEGVWDGVEDESTRVGIDFELMTYLLAARLRRRVAEWRGLSKYRRREDVKEESKAIAKQYG